MRRLFYDHRQNALGNDSFSPSAGKPAAFVEAALARFPGRVTAVNGLFPLTADEIALAHDRSHVDAILECRAPKGFGNNLALVAGSLPWTTGSFVAAARAAALDGGAACSPTSGFHHAGFGSSMGFCTFNGLADFDAHYGNATADIIERLGLDYIVNHSLGRFIGAFAELESMFEGCDLLFYQAGADPHTAGPPSPPSTARAAARTRLPSARRPVGSRRRKRCTKTGGIIASTGKATMTRSQATQSSGALAAAERGRLSTSCPAARSSASTIATARAVLPVAEKHGIRLLMRPSYRLRNDLIWKATPRPISFLTAASSRNSAYIRMPIVKNASDEQSSSRSSPSIPADRRGPQ